jgi:hypothetical protein
MTFFDFEQIRFMKRMYLFLMSLFATLITIAQDGGTDVKVDIGSKDSGGGLFTSPLVWIIGAAVFILLLVALTRGRRD